MSLTIGVYYHLRRWDVLWHSAAPERQRTCATPMNSKRIHPTLWGVSNVLGSSIDSCQQAPKLQQLHYLLLCCMNLHLHCFYNHSLVCPRVDISLPRSGQFSLHLSSNTACKKQLLLNPQPRQRQAVTYGDVHLATWAFHVRKDLSAVSFPSLSLPLSLSPCSWILDTETVTFFYLSWLLLLFCFHHFHRCHGATLQKLCIVPEWTL